MKHKSLLLLENKIVNYILIYYLPQIKRRDREMPSVKVGGVNINSLYSADYSVKSTFQYIPNTVVPEKKNERSSN